MSRRAGITGVLAILLSLLFARAAKTARDSTGGLWVPFVAKRIDRVRVVAGTGEASSYYARDSHGSLYMRVNRETHSGLIRADRGAFLYDRPHQTTYYIDFKHKVVRVRPVPANLGPEYQPEPLSRQAFDDSHSGDTLLGRLVISGVECEGYRLSKVHSKVRSFNEVWYAPSLNFMPVRLEARHRSRLVQDIQVGVEPDPSLFRLPTGFKLLK